MCVLCLLQFSTHPILCKAADAPHSGAGKVEQGRHTPPKSQAPLWGTQHLAATLEPPTGRLALPLQGNIPQLSLLCGFLPCSVPPSLYLTSSHGSSPPLKAAQSARIHPSHSRRLAVPLHPSLRTPKMLSTFPRWFAVGLGRCRLCHQGDRGAKTPSCPHVWCTQGADTWV